MFGRSKNFPSDVEKQLEAAIDRVRQLAAGADPDPMTRRPAEDAWSAAECVEHLNVSARLYLPTLADAIRGARARDFTGSRPDGRTLLGRAVAWSMEPPPRFKTRTVEKLRPPPDLDPRDLAGDFASLHRQLADQLNGARDLDRKKIRVRSVIDPRLQLSLDDWYAFIAAHVRRHLWQAERALEAARHSNAGL